ncbi:MAG: hypothetical protein JNK15_07215 [Planctomycetes bacterium]|nr:hypothetical protein [Planctomycetota bacterium]
MNGNDASSKPADPDGGQPTVEDLHREAIDRARVDLAKVCADRAGRARVYGILRQVDRWGLLREIAPYIRVEKGALQRGLRVEEHLVGPCSQAIGVGLQLFEGLDSEVRRVVQGGPQFVQVAKQPTAYEQIVLGGLQRWLDALAESQGPMNPFMLETIAGFAGCGVEALRRFLASTAVEAAMRIGLSVRHAIAQSMPHPFLWLGLVPGQGRKALPVSGRPRPETPADTADDDREILLAVSRGAKKPKAIFARLVSHGVELKQLRIRQRKKDLVQWGFLVPRAGEWKLSEIGTGWVNAIRAELRHS